MSQVHVQFDGRSDDIEATELFPGGVPAIAERTGVLAAGNEIVASVKDALADYYDRPISEFSSYEVVVEPGGDITVRPPAVFGNL